MDFRHLQYFVAVAEELHFRRAAERLHIVQPALSQQIARLEQELGVQLLARSKREVALTDAGRAFLADARDLLDRRDQAVESARRAALGLSGRLRVGFVGPAAYSVLPTVVRAHRDRCPDVDLVLEELTTAEQVELVTGHALDVGIVRLPLLNELLMVEQVLTEQLVAVLPEGHRLSGHADVDLADLAADPFIVVPRSREPAVADLYVSLCVRAGFSPRVVQEAQQVTTMIGLVAAGLGVALVPASMSNLRRPGVLYLPLRAPADAEVGTGLVWLVEDGSPAVRAFRETVRETLAVPAGERAELRPDR